MGEFQVHKSNIGDVRIVNDPTPEIGDGEILLRIERFALTANNVTYAVVGERIGYWKFFPAEEGWGVIPVWGFADVVASNCAEVPVGDRLYGYFPMGTHLRITPVNVKPTRLVDGAPHRAELPPVYNGYARVRAEPGYDPDFDDDRMALYPLYATSYCLYDFLGDNKWFGAEQIVIVSASSKTGIGLAYALADDDAAPMAIALTSARNRGFVESLGLYDSVATYDVLETIDAGRPTAIVDMSGNGAVLAALHRRLGEKMTYTSNVGLTHWDENEMEDGFIRDRSAMFFAPGHIQKRAGDWGAGVFESKALAFWRAAAEKSRSWMTLREIAGLEALEPVYADVRDGRMAPSEGVVVRP